MADEFAEFIKSHTGGWGKIPLQKTDGIRTFQLLSVEGDVRKMPEETTPINIEIITARKLSKVLTYEYGYILRNAEWYYPESKYVNTPNFVVRCVAFPSRQYMKVLTQRNCYFSDALLFRLPADLTPLLRVSVLDTLDNYSSAYPVYQSCLEQIASGFALGRAFSRRFLVMNHPQTGFPIIVYKGSAIGYDSGTRIYLTPSAEQIADTLASLTGKTVAIEKGAVRS